MVQPTAVVMVQTPVLLLQHAPAGAMLMFRLKAPPTAVVPQLRTMIWMVWPDVTGRLMSERLPVPESSSQASCVPPQASKTARTVSACVEPSVLMVAMPLEPAVNEYHTPLLDCVVHAVGSDGSPMSVAVALLPVAAGAPVLTMMAFAHWSFAGGGTMTETEKLPLPGVPIVESMMEKGMVLLPVVVAALTLATPVQLAVTPSRVRTSVSGDGLPVSDAMSQETVEMLSSELPAAAVTVTLRVVLAPWATGFGEAEPTPVGIVAVLTVNWTNCTSPMVLAGNVSGVVDAGLTPSLMMRFIVPVPVAPLGLTELVRIAFGKSSTLPVRQSSSAGLAWLLARLARLTAMKYVPGVSVRTIRDVRLDVANSSSLPAPAMALRLAS